MDLSHIYLAVINSDLFSTKSRYLFVFCNGRLSYESTFVRKVEVLHYRIVETRTFNDLDTQYCQYVLRRPYTYTRGQRKFEKKNKEKTSPKPPKHETSISGESTKFNILTSIHVILKS